MHGHGAGQPAEPLPRGFTVMFGADDNPQWQVGDGLFRADYQWAIGKVGLDSPAGWIAFHQASQQAAFIEQFAYVPGAAVSGRGRHGGMLDGGRRQGGQSGLCGERHHLMETEVLGPLTHRAGRNDDVCD